MTQTPSRELPLPRPLPGIPMLLLALLLLLSPAVLIPAAVKYEPTDPSLSLWLGLAMIPAVLAAVLVLRGLVLVNPNQAKVVLLFGRYVGTLRNAGFWWINPFTNRRLISLRVRNFNTETLKVNDLRGNPVEIGSVIVWRVADSAQATFDVENFESYVAVQSESALRSLSARHPYDAPQAGQTSLRGDNVEVSEELQRELTERLAHAGIEVIEVRLSHLAYAPEIAGVMLRRQQAEAIIDARVRIVEGAVSMVEMALDQLGKRQIIALDEERKAAMVSNLLVVLCSDNDATPVINTGTLHN